MRKQFIIALSALMLVGCGSNATSSSNDLSTLPPAAESNKPSEEIADESTQKPEEDLAEEMPEETPQPEAPAKPEASAKPEETVKPKPSAKPEETVKPKPSPKPEETVKPKPSPKPEAPTKPNNKPEAPVETPKPDEPEESPKPETPPVPEASLSASEVLSQITSDLDLPGLTSLDDDLLNNLYGIDVNLLESYDVKMPMLSFQITEIGVFKVKDIKDVDTIVEGINSRADNVGQMLYPSLIETFEARKVVTKGQYILFAMDDAADTIAANFDSIIK